MTDKKVNEADVIWEELRSLSIDMFALPDQMVENHLLRVRGVPNELYLRAKSAAALPALEVVLKGQVTRRVEQTAQGSMNVSYPKYDMEQTELYIVVKRHALPQEESELRPALQAKDGMVVVPGDIDSPLAHTPLAPKAVKPE